MGRRRRRVVPSAAAATAGSGGGGCCSGAAAPPTFDDEAAVLHGWEDRRAAGDSSSPPPEAVASPRAPLAEVGVHGRGSGAVGLAMPRSLGPRAASGLCSSGTTPSSSKMAPSGRASVPAKAYAVAASLSPVSTLHRLEQVAMPASAYVIVGSQVITIHSGEEDAHANSGVHNEMPDVNAGHGHHRGQELSGEHEYFSEWCNSGCDLGIVTEKSSSTIAPEMVPTPSYGDYTAESSAVCVSNHWGFAPDATDIDDFGLPDDLGIY
ncbi:hypothetical protein HU200_033245 [Digitaria exilis]|uniref:Uncharacterized protein n=1 Tax=Digitaria exilis TaxID=1010633 RepID=A0A835BLW3_9POAL|nr:hypothetical protein HU200_033245 [Digitaria exilis]